MYKCPECGKAYTSKYNLQGHCEDAHGLTLLDVEACKERIVNSEEGR